MYNYSIMALDTDHLDRIVEDIAAQYRDGVADCALFSMTLVPEGSPAVDKAAILGEKYDLFRDALAARGFSCGMLVQASIGHGYALNDPFPFQRYVNLTDGKEEFVCCPYDEDFRAFFRGQMRSLARHRPALIMVDDDLRLMFRGGKGCACPRHMAEFNRRAGTALTREELWAAIQKNDAEGRRLAVIFADTQRDSLVGAAREYRAGVDEVDPAIPGAYCTAGGEFAAELAHALCGKGHPVILRLNNGNYSPAGARYLSLHMQRAAYQAATLSEPVDVLLAETDTCPQNRYSTGAQSLHSHFTGTILEGVNGAKHWITRLAADEPASGRAYRRILSKHHGFYEALAALVPQATPLGCRIPMPSRWLTPLDPCEPFNAWPTCVLERLGLPLYFSKTPGGAVFLDDHADESFSDEEIAAMLTGPVFLSGQAAAHLAARGFKEDIGVKVRPWTGKHLAGEHLFVNGNCCSAQVGAMELIPCSDAVRVESMNYHIPDGKTRVPMCPGVTVFDNPRGGRVTVFCGTPDTEFHYTTAFSFLNESRKQQMMTLLRQVGQLPVCYPEDAEVYLRAFLLPDGTCMVGFFNIGLDPLEEIPLEVEKPVNHVERLMPDGTRKTCDFTADGGRITVREPAPTLDPVILFLYN